MLKEKSLIYRPRKVLQKSDKSLCSKYLFALAGIYIKVKSDIRCSFPPVLICAFRETYHWGYVKHVIHDL